jgi:hypothetical protein
MVRKGGLVNPLLWIFLLLQPLRGIILPGYRIALKQLRPSRFAGRREIFVALFLPRREARE